ncbi:MAG: sigma factor G inhibitor Gin [Bacillota bacterium]
MTTPQCFGCGESIPGGIQILGQYLCPACEAKVVRTKAGKLDYQIWIAGFRRFWEETGINVGDSDD